jgi:hypothetical protein
MNSLLRRIEATHFGQGAAAVEHRAHVRNEQLERVNVMLSLRDRAWLDQITGELHDRGVFRGLKLFGQRWRLSGSYMPSLRTCCGRADVEQTLRP